MTKPERGQAGPTLDSFLAEDGVLEEATEHAMKRVLARQIGQEMKARKPTKATMARQVRSSPAQLDRLLDPENSPVTLHTLHVAASLGKRLRVEAV
jgi:hypothetical protein